MQFGKQHGLTLVKDFGNGAVLYRKRRARCWQAISILLALLIGFLLVQVLDPARRYAASLGRDLFECRLRAGIGIGLTSIVFLLLDVSGAATPAAIFGIDIALAGGLAWQWFRTRTGRPARSNPDPNECRAFAGLGCSGCRSGSFCNRLGSLGSDGDRAARWRLGRLGDLESARQVSRRTRRRLALRAIARCSTTVIPTILLCFPPLSRASGKPAGSMDTLAPVLTGLVFFAALIALLVSAVALLRSTASALLAGLVILSTTSLLIWAPSQYADIPLAFYYLGAIALIFLGSATAAPLGISWAGLCAGLAAWTKNEGIAFLVCFLDRVLRFHFLETWRGTLSARGGWLLAGAAPGILLTLWLKFFLAPGGGSVGYAGRFGAGAIARRQPLYGCRPGILQQPAQSRLGRGASFDSAGYSRILVRWHIEEATGCRSDRDHCSGSRVFVLLRGVSVITPYGSGMASSKFVRSPDSSGLAQFSPGLFCSPPKRRGPRACRHRENCRGQKIAAAVRQNGIFEQEILPPKR